MSAQVIAAATDTPPLPFGMQLIEIEAYANGHLLVYWLAYNKCNNNKMLLKSVRKFVRSRAQG